MIVVDYFAGAGGWSTAARLAGLHVAAAVNHWARAVETHRANHPDTLHFCQDASLLDPREVPRPDVFLASPECIAHTPANGGEKPHHDASRSTAWCVTRFAELVRPPLVFVENVVEFRSKWVLYPQWRSCLEALGYAVSENVLDAADFGVPQERVRLIIVGVLGARHAPVLAPPRDVARRSALDVIDFTAGRWLRVDAHVEKTRQRAAAGRARFGERFVMPYYGRGSGATGRALDRPIGTLTTKARWAVVDGDMMRMVSVDECRAFMGFPPGYVLTGDQREQHHQLGNAVCPPFAEGVLRQALEAA